MDNWKSFNEDSTKYYYTGYDPVPGLSGYYVQFQYDADYSYPELVRCRVKCGHDSWTNGYGTDYIYLYSPTKNIFTSSDKKKSTDNFLMHNGNSRDIPAYNVFYLTKTWSDGGFTFPEFWICVQGRQGTLGTFDPKLFKSGGSRTAFVTKITKNLPYYDGWTPVSLSGTKGTVNVRDNKDNSFTVYGALPKDAHKNSVNSATVHIEEKYASGGVFAYYTAYAPSSPEMKDKDRKYTISDDIRSKTKVTAYVSGEGTWDNPSPSSEVEKTIIYYTNPQALSEKPTITPYYDASMTKVTTKLTPRSKFRVGWKIATGGNTDSPTSGCRLYFILYKHSEQKEYSYGSNNATVRGDSKGYRYSDIPYYDLNSGHTTKNTKYTFNMGVVTATANIDHSKGKCYIDFDAKDFNMSRGDVLWIWIESWHHHKDLNKNDKFYISYAGGSSNVTPILSANSVSKQWTVESSGVLWVRTDSNSLKECRTYVRTDDGWKESIGVYIKTANGWKESI